MHVLRVSDPLLSAIMDRVRVKKSAEKIDFSAMLNGENDDDDQRATVTEECGNVRLA